MARSLCPPRQADRSRNADWSSRAALIALLALTGAALAVALPGDYVFDDVIDVARNPAATPARFIESLPYTVRPLLKASYAATSGLLGASAFPQRAVNIAFHLMSTLLVYVLLDRLLAGAGDVRRRWTALLGTGMWALHPVVTETVVYVSGRSMGLSSLLLLAAFTLATAESLTPASRFATFALAFVAPLARETALVLPALLLLWQFTAGSGQSLAAATRRQLPVWLGAVAAAGALAVMPRHRALVAFSLQTRDPLEALLGNLHAMLAMLRMWVAPWEVSIDPALPEIYGWNDFETVWRLALLGATAAFVILARRRMPVAVFAIGWTLLNLFPTNSIIWRIDPVGTRPLYLASVGLTVGVVWTISATVREFRGMTAWPTAAAAGVLIAALSAATVTRAALYRSPEALWEDAASKAPGKARPHANLGLLHLQAGRLQEAEHELKRALDLEPWDRDAACALEAVRIQRQDVKVATEPSDEGAPR